jgi:uncharacterized protein YigE (DUF2233 family)
MINKKTIYILLPIFFISLIILMRLVFNSNKNTTQIQTDQKTKQDLYETVIISPTSTSQIQFFWKKPDNNKNIQTIAALKSYIKEKNQGTLTFATNGGIFDPTYTPLGLYIESGKELVPINNTNGTGNFYLKPNGIFAIYADHAEIKDATEFTSDTSIIHALQSGPLLLKQGVIHPAFSPTSTSKYIRSGVGIDTNGNILFAISNKPVTFYEFAIYFKETLHATNALYLDGAISEMYIDGKKEKTERRFAGIIGVIK